MLLLRHNLLRPRLLGYLSSGQYFGEYSCLLGEVRTATVVAADFCELYSLARHDLEGVITKWPELAAEFDRLIEGYRRAGVAKVCVRRCK